MKRSLILITFLSFLLSSSSFANRLIGIQVVDKDYLMLHFRDGEVRYRDDATGPRMTRFSSLVLVSMLN